MMYLYVSILDVPVRKFLIAREGYKVFVNTFILTTF